MTSTAAAPAIIPVLKKISDVQLSALLEQSGSGLTIGDVEKYRKGFKTGRGLLVGFGSLTGAGLLTLGIGTVGLMVEGVAVGIGTAFVGPLAVFAGQGVDIFVRQQVLRRGSGWSMRHIDRNSRTGGRNDCPVHIQETDEQCVGRVQFSSCRLPFVRSAEIRHRPGPEFLTVSQERIITYCGGARTWFHHLRSRRPG